MVSIPRPSKDLEQSRNNRPIALLSPVAKLAEKVLLPILETHKNFQKRQHAFRPKRSTNRAPKCINHVIQSGLNKPKPCHRDLLVALDMKSAFDTVSHGTLLHDFKNTDLPNHAKQWLLSSLRGRQTYTEHEGTRSKRREVKQGVPPSEVFSPSFSNLYMRSVPITPQEISIVTYADDITFLTSGPKVENPAAKLNTYLADLNLWLESKSNTFVREVNCNNFQYMVERRQLQPKRHHEWQNNTRDKKSQDSRCQVRQHDELRSPQQEHRRKIGRETQCR